MLFIPINCWRISTIVDLSAPINSKIDNILWIELGATCILHIQCKIKGVLPSFLNEIQVNKITKDYWKECESSRTVFSSSDLEEMKKCVMVKWTNEKYWIMNANVSQDVLEKFDCGHPDFNDFLANDAICFFFE